MYLIRYAGQLADGKPEGPIEDLMSALLRADSCRPTSGMGDNRDAEGGDN